VTQRVTSLQPPLNQVAIVLDGVVITDPSINEAIPTGQAEITGGFTQTTARELASNLRFGRCRSRSTRARRSRSPRRSAPHSSEPASSPACSASGWSSSTAWPTTAGWAS
jgi:hypothetical protein